MTPERAGALVVVEWSIDARGEGVWVERLDPLEGASFLRVSWYSTTAPVDEVDGQRVVYWSLGKGVVFVRPAERYRRAARAKAQLHALGGDRYRWEDFTEGDALMLVLILPDGRTARDAEPSPIAAKDFKGRIALYWSLRPRENGHVTVTWRAEKLTEAAAADAQRINLASAQERGPIGVNVEEQSPSVTAPRIPSDVASALAGIGLNVEYLPGLAGGVVISLLALEVLARSSLATPFLTSVDQPTLHAALLALSVVVALIAYVTGDVWDDIVFDPLYSTNGRWTTRARRPLRMFPPGLELERSRATARRVLEVGPEDSVYKRASRLALPPRQKEEIDSKLALSKAVRTLILPALIAGLLCVIGGLWPGSVPWPRSELVALGLVFILVGILMFGPYISLRVQHMVTLYDAAVIAIRDR